MECTSCEYFKINDYKFQDKTQTMECVKFNKFLGFTDKKGKATEIKAVNECLNKKATVTISAPVAVKTKKGVNGIRSGVRGISWDNKSKAWRINHWDNAKKKIEYLGSHKDLEEAKKILKEFADREI